MQVGNDGLRSARLIGHLWFSLAAILLAFGVLVARA